MERIAYPYKPGDWLNHYYHGLGQVLEVRENERGPDKVKLIFLGGVTEFLAGSHLAKEWKKE